MQYLCLFLPGETQSDTRRERKGSLMQCAPVILDSLSTRAYRRWVPCYNNQKSKIRMLNTLSACFDLSTQVRFTRRTMSSCSKRIHCQPLSRFLDFAVTRYRLATLRAAGPVLDSLQGIVHLNARRRKGYDCFAYRAIPRRRTSARKAILATHGLGHLQSYGRSLSRIVGRRLGSEPWK